METDYTLKLLIEAQDKFSSTFNSTISTLKKTVAGLGVSLTALGTVKSVVKLADDLEQCQIAFTTMLGSGEKAKAMLQDLSDFAKKTPFELTSVRQNAKQLLAMGVQAEEIIPTLKSLGDVSAGLSVPLERLALNYGQVIAQGKLTGRELRDFTMAGVPLLDELSNMLGKTTTQIQDMISAGEISSADVVQAFQNMSSEGGKFSDLMSKQSTTLTGLRSNFQDSLSQLGEEIGMELLPSLKEYTQQLGEWLDNNIDEIKAVASAVIETAKVIADNVISLVGSIAGVVSDFASFVNDVAGGIADSTAQGMNESSNATAQGLTGMAGNRKDFFYYVQQGISAIAGAIKTALNMADSLVKTVGKKSFWSGLYQAGNVKVNSYEKGDNIFQTIGNWGKAQIQDFKDSAQGMKTYLKEEMQGIKDTRTESTNDLYQSLEDNYANQVEKLTATTYSAQPVVNNMKSFASEVNTALQGLGDVGGGSGGKSKVEKMSEEMKALIKEMDEYAKDTEKMRKSTYEGIVDSMEDAVKSAEKLTKEIGNLQEKIDELNQSETKNIAESYVEAENKLNEYKLIYEDIVDLANEFEKDELKRKDKDRTINGYSAKELLEVKELYENMQSAYKGMSEEETAQLDAQIEKQREYSQLTDIEKIRADYEEKRQILQAELDDKMEALNQEIDKYRDLNDKKIKYEKSWLDYMHYSFDEQTKMNNQIESQLRRIIALREEAGMGFGLGNEHRAGGGMVYTGQSYIVGEHGPELFTPSQRGSITPTNQITNNNGIEINISGISVRSDSDIQQIADEITRRIKLEKDYGIIS